MTARGNQARDMRHVHHQQRSHVVGNGAEPFVVHGPRIGARSRHDEPRAVFAGKFGQGVVVDGLRFLRHAIGHDVVKPSREVHRTSHGQVAAVGEVHSEIGVAGLEDREVDRHVGLGARVRLDIHVLRPEEFPCPLHRQALHHVHVLAAAVVALAGITLGVLVGHEGALGFQNSLAHDVLGSDQLQVGFQPFGLVVNRLKHFRIDLLQTGGNQSRILASMLVRAATGPGTSGIPDPRTAAHAGCGNGRHGANGDSRCIR